MFAQLAAAATAATTMPTVDEGPSIFGVHVPGWAISSIVVIAGVYVIIRAIRKVVPEAGGLASDVLDQYNTLSRRQDHVAEAVLNIAQASPEPPDASAKRAKAVEHAEAALSLSTTALPPPSDPAPPDPGDDDVAGEKSA